MTRPKRVRQRAKSAQRDCREMPIFRRVWAQLSPKYAVELALLDGGPGIYPVQIFWHPREPADHEMMRLRDAFSAEIAQLMSTAADHDDGRVAP
jgi:hypothetical protein